MNDLEWNATTDSASAARRAGGRRHYNAVRQFQADERRRRVVELLDEIGFCRGYQSKIAKALGVHRSTISRDFQYFWFLEKGCSPFEIFLRRKAERNQEIPLRRDTSPTDERFDPVSNLIRELAAKGLRQQQIDTILNHLLS